MGSTDMKICEHLRMAILLTIWPCNFSRLNMCVCVCQLACTNLSNLHFIKWTKTVWNKMYWARILIKKKKKNVLRSDTDFDIWLSRLFHGSNEKLKMHQPGIEPGSVPWQGTILPLDHWCFLILDLTIIY